MLIYPPSRRHGLLTQEKLNQAFTWPELFLPVKVPPSLVPIVNLTDNWEMLGKREVLSALHPVEVEKGNSLALPEKRITKKAIIERLLNSIAVDVPDEYGLQLRRLLEEYEDILFRDNNDLGRTHLTQHRIDTGAEKPIRQPLRRQRLPYMRVIDENLDKMLANEIIEPAMR